MRYQSDLPDWAGSKDACYRRGLPTTFSTPQQYPSSPRQTSPASRARASGVVAKDNYRPNRLKTVHPAEVELQVMLTTLSLILAAACLIPAGGKLTNHPQMRASAARFGIAWQRYQLIGLAELGAAVGVLAGLLWRPLGLAAGMCLAVLLLAAILTHVRTGDRGRELMPALLILAIDALYLALAFSS